MAKVEAEVGKRPEGVWGGLIQWIDDRFPMCKQPGILGGSQVPAFG